MKKIYSFGAVFALTLALVGCGGSDETEVTSSSSSGAAVITRIPACSEYLENMQKCVDEVLPEAQANIYQNAIEQNREAWEINNQMTDEEREEIEAACIQANTMAAQSMTQLGCKW